MFDFDKALVDRERKAAKEKQDYQDRLAKAVAEAESLEVTARSFLQSRPLNISIIRNGPDVHFSKSDGTGITFTAKGDSRYAYKFTPKNLAVGLYPSVSSQNLTETEVQDLIFTFLGL